MKAKELAEILLQNPEAEVLHSDCDGEVWDVSVTSKKRIRDCCYSKGADKKVIDSYFVIFDGEQISELRKAVKSFPKRDLKNEHSNNVMLQLSEPRLPKYIKYMTDQHLLNVEKLKRLDYSENCFIISGE